MKMREEAQIALLTLMPEIFQKLSQGSEAEKCKSYRIELKIPRGDYL